MHIHKWQYLIAEERVLIAKLCFRIGSSVNEREQAVRTRERQPCLSS